MTLALLIVIVITSETLPDVAVIATVPSFNAVTLPPASTVAVFGSLDVNVIFLSVAFDGSTVALNVMLSPTYIDVLSFLIVTFVTLTVSFPLCSFAVTVIAVVAIGTSSTQTEINAVPAAFAVTVPFESTVAMSSVYDFHVYFVPDGVTVAVKFIVSPHIIVSDGFAIAAFLLGSSFPSYTVTIAQPVVPATVTVISDTPGFDAVIFLLLSILTTDALLLFHSPADSGSPLSGTVSNVKTFS